MSKGCYKNCSKRYGELSPVSSRAAACVAVNMKFILLLGSVCAVSAMPSYIAVPVDQIAFVDLTELRARRVSRQTQTQELPQALYDDSYQPIPIQHSPLQNYEQQGVALAPPSLPEAPARLVHYQQQPDTAIASTRAHAAQLAERPPDFGEYVDFGAHTGDHGAFGWYADYPVNKQENHYRK